MLLIGWGSVIACAVMLLAMLRSREKTIPPAWVEATGPQRRFVVVISDPKASLGRSPGNQIVLDTPEVSRRHAEIVWNGKTFLVTDLGSKNGTRLNGQRVDTAELSDGDRLEIGTWGLVFAKGQWGPDHSD